MKRMTKIFVGSALFFVGGMIGSHAFNSFQLLSIGLMFLGLYWLSIGTIERN